MTRQFFFGLVIAALTLAIGANAQAALIAHYDFTDGDMLDNELGATRTLTHVQNGTGSVSIDPTYGFAHFPGNDSSGGNHAYLEASGPGGKPHFTVSFWFRTDSFDQGDYQGLFSNQNSSANYTWQIDNHGANMRLISQGNPTLTYADSNLSVDTWYHTVLRKETGAGGDYTQVYITAEGQTTVNKVMNQNENPGGLFKFRLGTNRNTDKLFRMDIANVKIYDDSTVDLDALLAEGPSLIPEPGALSLAAFALLALLRRRRRA